MGMFGAGFGTKLGLAGDILTGNPVTQSRLQQEALDAIKNQQAMAEVQRAQIEAQRANRPQLFNSGDGQITAVDPTTLQLSQLQAPRAPEPHIPETLQLINEYQRRLSLNPHDPSLPMLAQAVRGYQYSQPVLDARQNATMAEIAARGAQARTTRAQPTYSNLHPHTPAAKPGAYSQVSDADLLAALRK